ncbi:hypothetical protein F8M41_024514 [Gigaspora margarita]|uniref:Uncharacterized protein n=1 Tax=Gigaspora margarita TaxID=4874 RepID=A0A8H3XKZ8_GIGMA|nr:hypothetical protein F8M41_024514 [Gigaspora margarita]
MRSQIGGSSRPPNNPRLISVDTFPFMAPIAASTLLGAQFNNRNHNYNFASHIMSAIALVSPPEVLSSSQVTSDSSVPKRQFKINNPIIPQIINKKKYLPLRVPLGYPPNLSCTNDSSSRNPSSVLSKNSPAINVSTRRNKISSPFLTVPDSISPSIFYENESSDSNNSDIEWYEATWGNRRLKYEFGENDSDADENVDELV